MLRRTILIAAGIVLLLIGAVAASGRSSANDPYVGTWSVANRPGDNANTPWKNGGTFTVTVAQRSEVEAYKDVSGPGGRPSGIRGDCVGYGNPSTDAVVSVWYLASYSWGGTQGTMAGCISDRTQGIPDLYGQGTQGELHSGPSACGPVGTCLTGYWTDSDAPYLTFAASHGAAGTTKTVTEPDPGTGRGYTFDYEAFKRNQASLELYAKIVNEEQAARGDALAADGGIRPGFGGLVAWCWLTEDFEDEQGRAIPLSPAEQLQACWIMAQRAVKLKKVPARLASAGAAQALPAMSASSGCKTKAIPLLLRKRKGKYVLAGRATKAKVSTSPVRYSCSMNGPVATITMKSKTTLGKALGKKLVLVAYRAKKAPKQSGKLTFTFG